MLKKIERTIESKKGLQARFDTYREFHRELCNFIKYKIRDQQRRQTGAKMAELCPRMENWFQRYRNNLHNIGILIPLKKFLVPQLAWDVPDELVSARFYDTKAIKAEELKKAIEEAGKASKKTDEPTNSQLKETGIECKERDRYENMYEIWKFS